MLLRLIKGAAIGLLGEDIACDETSCLLAHSFGYASLLKHEDIGLIMNSLLHSW